MMTWYNSAGFLTLVSSATLCQNNQQQTQKHNPHGVYGKFWTNFSFIFLKITSNLIIKLKQVVYRKRLPVRAANDWIMDWDRSLSVWIPCLYDSSSH